MGDKLQQLRHQRVPEKSVQEETTQFERAPANLKSIRALQ
jgi:hypothetical protein